jgi:hypothetical protein
MYHLFQCSINCHLANQKLTASLNVSCPDCIYSELKLQVFQPKHNFTIKHISYVFQLLDQKRTAENATDSSPASSDEELEEGKSKSDAVTHPESKEKSCEGGNGNVE